MLLTSSKSIDVIKKSARKKQSTIFKMIENISDVLSTSFDAISLSSCRSLPVPRRRNRSKSQHFDVISINEVPKRVIELSVFLKSHKYMKK